MSYSPLLLFSCALLACGCTDHSTDPSKTPASDPSRPRLSSRGEAGLNQAVGGRDSAAPPGTPGAGCRADFVYEVREPAPAGHANVFVGVTNWDASNEDCWSSLSEYYNNIAPDSGVTHQDVYFIAEPRSRAGQKVYQMSQLTDEVKRRVIGVAVYDSNAEELSFTEAPFAKSKR